MGTYKGMGGRRGEDGIRTPPSIVIMTGSSKKNPLHYHYPVLIKSSYFVGINPQLNKEIFEAGVA